MNLRIKKWLLILPCLPVIAAWNNFIVPSGTTVSDILISHFPNLLYLQRSLAAGRGIPLWSPLILSGYPFAADPLSSLWYPPAWLCLVFPLPLGINLVMALHIGLGSLGMYRFLNHLNLSDGVAILGGILYGSLPAGFSHVIAGHFTWVCASAWLPWLLACTLDDLKNSKRSTIQAAIYLGMMLLADMRFAAYAAVFWLALILFNFAKLTLNDSMRFQARQLGNALFSLLLAAGISAAVWIPLLEYTELSTRNLMTAKDMFYLSLPVVQLTGLVIPGYPQSMEWVIYPGAGCLILSLGGVTIISKKKELIFWFAICAAFMLWALGDVIPVNQWLVTLPAFNLLRVPARGLFFSDFCLLIISMIFLDWLLKNNPQKAVFLRLGTLFLTMFALLFQVFVLIANPQKNSFLIEPIIIWSLTAGFILLYSYRRISKKTFLLLIGIVISVDLFLTNINLMNWITPQKALSTGQEEVKYLKEQGNNFRVFSPSYSIPQQTAGYFGIEMADGIDPLQLKTYAEYVKQSASIPDNNYSVTLPPYQTGDTRNDNREINPDARDFGRLNIKYLVSAFPINSPGWKETSRTENSIIYQNILARGWAWIEPVASTNWDEYQPVIHLQRGINRVQVDVEGPGRLVLSEIYYPGWQARVDGQLAAIEPINGLLRSVVLGNGKHHVEFLYLPEKVFAGAGISLLSLLLFILLLRVGNPHAD